MLSSGSSQPLPPAAANPPAPAAPSRASDWRVFLLLFGVALAYAAFTSQVWEDYYITYRASKNLATGHGLVFNPGERVHSFTSPLGVLLPAAASLLTGNTSDVAALWIFRVMTMAAYAGAGLVLWRLARSLFGATYPAVFLVLLLATDAKSVDNAINGMESALVLLFMAWNLWALFRAPPQRVLHFGLAWTGLMWSRPDSFIYVGASAVAVLLFGAFARPVADRRVLILDFLRAGALTTVLYGPWIAWAWWYYGSFVPHTIVAKSVWTPPVTLESLGSWLLRFPLDIWKGSSTLGTTFSPPYAMNTGWPAFIIRISAGLSLAVMAVWLLPFMRWQARVASFVFTAAHFYLAYMANFPAPWYLPIVAMLGFFTFACVVGQLWEWLDRRARAAGPPFAGRAHRGIVAGSLLLPLAALLLLLCTAWEMRVRMRIIEEGSRRQIGEWLQANASSPRDTVVLECLGYIGFYSNLKIYDYPGLSSPEVVQVLRTTKTRADYTHYFPEIANAYNPDWIVLRLHELGNVNEVDRELLKDYYHLAQVFDRRQEVAAVKFLPGRDYCLFDAYFAVYRRNESLPDHPGLRRLSGALRHRVSLAKLTTNKAWNGQAYLNDGRILAHVPSELATPVPAGATLVMGEFGFFPDAYAGDRTKGAVFSVEAVAADGSRTRLYSRLLDPVKVSDDRGQHFFSAPITAPGATTVEFRIEPPPGQGNAFGWTYWTNLRFHVPEGEPVTKSVATE